MKEKLFRRRPARLGCLDAVFGGDVCERFFELGPGTIESGHNGADRDIEYLSDLFIIELVNIGQQDHAAIVFGKFVKCGDHLAICKILRHGCLLHRVCEYQFVGLLEIFRLGVFFAAMVTNLLKRILYSHARQFVPSS